MIWLITRIVLKSTSVSKNASPSYFAAANGLRKAYMQK